MNLSILVAVAENGVIGRENDLPWRLSADLKRFKEITMGHTIIMGRKTWDSIGRPLPGRTSVVISRQADYRTPFEEVRVVGTVEDALESSRESAEVFAVGGAAIYALALPLANRLYLTRVHAEVVGDTYFPDVDWQQWQMISEERHEPNERNDHPFSFQIFERES